MKQATKDATLIIRLSAAEKAAFTDAAAREQVSVSVWLRAAANGRLQEIRAENSKPPASPAPKPPSPTPPRPVSTSTYMAPGIPPSMLRPSQGPEPQVDGLSPDEPVNPDLLFPDSKS
jgi:hypothetical protein